MAIGPATAKALAKLVLAAAVNEEIQKKILAVIIGIVSFLLVMNALLVYLITSPLSLFAKWFGGEELAAVDIFQQEYGYHQSIGIFESDYLFSGNKDYENITFTDATVEMAYENQMDGKFKQEPYGTDKIGSCASYHSNGTKDKSALLLKWKK